ncbi:hypothetical protein GQ55_8G248400 [Panicum hallii var. hallii]|uniref:Uncharacterized protein n=1 Tax=Panicum hallii var. hallii TaxID=1504633 RepID=A0A2T7CR46_9POAL|nr:hypothetical protein GQ55_8G248400 [Panicum hallii var. hallii]
MKNHQKGESFSLPMQVTGSSQPVGDGWTECSGESRHEGRGAVAVMPVPLPPLWKQRRPSPFAAGGEPFLPAPPRLEARTCCGRRVAGGSGT